ncbi:hypothetical protein FGG08_004972 [Glutinoglossum americanum]|uniref:Transcription initiation factor TFIID subunit 4 n=1 Tax=Glutinoglossum americanum TaxID=1670608 RepID=A0A9P8L3C7_9PEZI|nr:hypothetical protein FGG08_004972 [Glutinoglossum americanum]
MSQPQPAGAMGPPSKPIEKATDTAELADVLASSGIDLKDEETFLTSSYNTANRQLNNVSFVANSVSFNSANSSQSTPGTLSASNSFNNNTSFGSIGESVLAITSALSGPPAPYNSAEEILKQEQKKANRRQIESKAFHLNDPFLSGGPLKNRVARRTYENGSRLPPEDAHHQPQRHASTTITGLDGSKVVAYTGTMVSADSTLSDILALLSLAAGERIRGLVEDAAALAKGRQTGSHGLVPPEWSDIAIGLGAEAAIPTSAANVRGGWESAVSPRTNPLKRMCSNEDFTMQMQFPVCFGLPHLGSFSSSNKLPSLVPGATVLNTISFPNEVAKSLRSLAQKERDAEESWLSRRSSKLQKLSNPAESGNTGSAGPGTPAPGSPAPGLLGERAPDIESGRKASAKEQRKQQASKLEEFNQHRSANSTANMMLGGGGLFGKGKKKQYAWMTSGGIGSSPGSPRLNTAMAGSSGLEGGSIAGGTFSPGKRIGEWREDREKGTGIQLRDWINALETDGREKKALVKAYARLNR